MTQSKFDSIYDLVVIEAGYAGVSAALNASKKGYKVLLVDLNGELLWESSRSFMGSLSIDQCATKSFNHFHSSMKSVNAANDREIDGAISEVMANRALVSSGVDVLYYALPVMAHLSGNDGVISALTLGTKSGFKVIRAKWWIDASENGVLFSLLMPKVELPKPDKANLFVYFQKIEWNDNDEIKLSFDDPDIEGCIWTKSMWSNQMRLSYILKPEDAFSFRSKIVPGIKKARHEIHDLDDTVFVSHISTRPFPSYKGSKVIEAPAPNLGLAVPSISGNVVESLEKRWELGERAIEKVFQGSACEESVEIKNIDFDTLKIHSTDCFVAGAGTGGAVAAISAAREGLDTIVVEPQYYPGGIGTGGGIFSYYWGVTGGLQNEIDEEVHKLMPLFIGDNKWVGFHPEAKKIVLESMMKKAGASINYRSILCGALCESSVIKEVFVASEKGLFRYKGKTYIDATGDGDLAAYAGAKFIFGRSVDKNLHAYTLSSGRFRVKERWDKGKDTPNSYLLNALVNYDSGYVDPTDIADLSRARQVGVEQYFQVRYDETQRPTYLAPHLGIRQGRQIETEYMLTLDDQLTRAIFQDSIGFTGCHYDNHAVDYEFESETAIFLVFGCGLRGAKTANEMPYRMILPKGVDNLWLACRAFGVSEEAHASTRMQRDIQRVGEVSGIAAALSIRYQCSNRDIPIVKLQKRLEKSSALRLDFDTKVSFGSAAGKSHWQELEYSIGSEEHLEFCFKDLKSRGSKMSLWFMYRYGREKYTTRIKELLESDDPDESWNAAIILSGWKDRSAESRLLSAIVSNEEGYEYIAVKDSLFDLENSRLCPRWWCAVVLLRFCISKRSLDALTMLSENSELQLNMRNAIGLNLEALAEHTMLSPEEKERASIILDRLIETEPPHRIAVPTRNPLTGLDVRFHKKWAVNRMKVEEDFLWQNYYSIARAKKALNEDFMDVAKHYLDDERKLVRSAFQALLT